MPRSRLSLDPLAIVGFLLVLVIGISMASSPAAAEDGPAGGGGGAPNSAPTTPPRNRPQPTRPAPAGAGGAASAQSLLPYGADASARLFGNGLHGDGYWPGRDYLAPCGTPLYNPLPGETTVEAVGIDSYCGPNGCNNTYARLNNGQYRYVLMHGDYVIKSGDRLSQGQLIGYEASNGNSSACHSHVSIRTGAGRLLDVARLN